MKKILNKIKKFIDEEKLIKHCYNVHINDLNKKAKFSFFEYRRCWRKFRHGTFWLISNRDKSINKCEIIYFPLPEYKELRALVEIKESKEEYDFRETPIYYLKKIK